MQTIELKSEAEKEALAKLEAMSDDEFLMFVAKLPPRVKLLAKSGMCNWREVLPAWYVKLETNASEEINPDDIPF